MFVTKNLYQNDEAWKTVPLGNSKETIGGWGCLLTSVTMMLNGIGYNETPVTVNEKINRKSKGKPVALHTLVAQSISQITGNIKIPGRFCTTKPGRTARNHFGGSPRLIVRISPSMPIQLKKLQVHCKNKWGRIRKNYQTKLKLYTKL